MSSILGIFLKVITFLAVIAIICLAFGIEIYAFIEMRATFLKMTSGYSEKDEIIKKSLKSLDLILLGVIFFTIATALFELYIAKIKKLPSWLVIKDLDGLKGLMIKMVIFIMSISFTGRIITYETGIDILYLGASLALVIVSLTYFLLHKKRV